MVDLVDLIRTNPTFRRLEIGELLFARYTCPAEEAEAGFWAHTDHLIHVLSGKKTWRTHSGRWVAEAGQTLYFKKGAYINTQHFEEAFCLMLFFIPDEVIRATVRELAADLPALEPLDSSPPALRLENDVALSAFLQAMTVFFAADEQPAAPLLRLKLKELIIGILTSRGNRALSSYFRDLATTDVVSIPTVMEASFTLNLEISELAAMCHRSLSSFKRDFHRHYGTSPGRWLLARRLAHAALLLSTTDKNVAQVGFDCGFEDPSHFCRAFKERFGQPPRVYRSAARSIADAWTSKATL